MSIGSHLKSGWWTSPKGSQPTLGREEGGGVEFLHSHPTQGLNCTFELPGRQPSHRFIGLRGGGGSDVLYRTSKMRDPISRIPGK